MLYCVMLCYVICYIVLNVGGIILGSGYVYRGHLPTQGEASTGEIVIRVLS